MFTCANECVWVYVCVCERMCCCKFVTVDRAGILECHVLVCNYCAVVFAAQFDGLFDIMYAFWALL